MMCRTHAYLQQTKGGTVLKCFVISVGFALSNHVITSHTAYSPMDCAMQCVAVWECVSINFRTTGGLENNCQLNDETKDSSLPTEYGEISGFVYYEASPEVRRSCGHIVIIQ